MHPLLELLEATPNPPKISPLLNRKIDAVFHKAAEKDKRLYLVDSLAHMLVETADSIALSIAKSIRWNFTKIIEGEEREK